MSETPKLNPEDETNLKLSRILLPVAQRYREAAAERQGVKIESGGSLRFAHYTNADAALNILRTRRIWMRNTTCMVDYREVNHGFEILSKYFTPERTTEFFRVFDQAILGAAENALKLFNGWWANRMNLSLYVTSMSEHSVNEDRHGRLSMWRAFGASGNPRVAIVTKIPLATGIATTLGITFSPVTYLTEDEAHKSIQEVLTNANANLDLLRSLGPNLLSAWIFTLLFVGVATLKHEGFLEEREWRAIHYPALGNAPFLESALEVISGVPQHVYKLPLDARVSPQLQEIDLPTSLDRVIVGPSPYPWVIYQAFVDELGRLGVPNPQERVITSGIPIRS